jgi:biofilm PGA synthesis N-glycosyltransferase PgaC
VNRGVVITIDADTVLAPDAIEKIIPPLMDEKVASVCGFVIPQKITTFWEKARFIEYLWGISIIKETQNLLGTPLVSSGCFSAYKIGALKRYGCFKNRTMVEDMDLTWEHLEDGYNVALISDAICYPLEPANYRTYHNQVLRWLRGFFQVLRVHKFKILKRPTLTFFVLWSLTEGFAYPLFLVVTIFLVIYYDLFLYFALFMTLGYLVPIIFAVLEARKKHEIKLAIQSIPAFILINPINTYLFIKSAWLELVLRKPLSVWEKGH